MPKFLILLLVSFFSLTSIVGAEVDFSGKTITWVVPFKDGGERAGSLGLFNLS